ncbi:L-valine transporter subunit YgaH [Photorhabdus heterorhabditis]|uniref:L-valine transporter subunit YgaH n=1 Tax=Photorhabdus heterorhabditis TaxID=880156 RepID=A0A5B0WUV7_9GAMM|nr:L-valine transporter subunit YgaH [Photorhabdus heterorhabditis]KAA1190723.1 L-valine transporter subunit YgaH [Photorhabdus heterorhabditis]MBS9442090.1 L-valine transporter subunit YgaH [Photorhabdus heterorhabditis]
MIDSSILLIGLFVGLANFLFRYLPLRFGTARQSAGRQGGKANIILDSIGIASICSLLIVSGVPDVMKDNQKLFPTLMGFLTICLVFYKTKKIILSTLLGALLFGLTFKIFMN